MFLYLTHLLLPTHSAAGGDGGRKKVTQLERAEQVFQQVSSHPDIIKRLGDIHFKVCKHADFADTAPQDVY